MGNRKRLSLFIGTFFGTALEVAKCDPGYKQETRLGSMAGPVIPIGPPQRPLHPGPPRGLGTALHYWAARALGTHQRLLHPGPFHIASRVSTHHYWAI
jgi:hypothetical protein